MIWKNIWKTQKNRRSPWASAEKFVRAEVGGAELETNDGLNGENSRLRRVTTLGTVFIAQMGLDSETVF